MVLGMGIHRQSLRALRRIALTHCHGDHPDLASLARDLGSAIHQHADSLQTGLADLYAASRFTRWPVRTRARSGVRMAVMAWPANHASPVHDHGSRWGLEISLHGALEVDAWVRDPLTGELARQGRHWLGPGDAVWFDADEPRVHRCRNLSRHDTALSLHIYGGAPDHPHAYQPASVESRPALPPPLALGGPLQG